MVKKHLSQVPEKVRQLPAWDLLGATVRWRLFQIQPNWNNFKAKSNSQEPRRMHAAHSHQAGMVRNGLSQVPEK